MEQIINSLNVPVTMEIEGIQINLTFSSAADPKLLETVRKMLLKNYAETTQK